MARSTRDLSPHCTRRARTGGAEGRRSPLAGRAPTGYPRVVSDKPTKAREVDELIRRAARDVDRTLIQWALSLSPLDRLRAAVRSAASLQTLRDARSKDR